MEKQNPCLVIGVPVTSASFVTEGIVLMPEESESQYGLCHDCKQDRKDLISNWLSKFRIKANNHVQGIREYVNLRPKISQTLKRNLDMGARFIKTGGNKRVFRKTFSVKGNEKLVISSHCYLSTTAGPIAGMLFISNEKIAFLSDRSLQIESSNNGEIARFRYKVVIPLSKISDAIPVENSEIANQKYVKITTVDEHDFWFKGFVRYQKFFKNLQRAVIVSQ